MSGAGSRSTTLCGKDEQGRFDLPVPTEVIR